MQVRTRRMCLQRAVRCKMSGVDADGLPPGYVLKPEYEISPRKLSELIAAKANLLIVDVRTASEREVAAISPSIHVPLHEIETRVEEILEEADGKQVVTYCHHGVRSLRASLFLRQVGASSALSMAGGIDAWSLAMDSKVPRYERNGTIVQVVR